jgi:hypothetical protein
MANLKKREIVILIIAVLFVLYAAYEYLIAGRTPGAPTVKPAGEPVKIETSIGGIAAELSKSKLSDVETYIIEKANDNWGKNPFLPANVYRAWLAKDGGKGVAAITIMYSGFIDTGRKRMAILNDIEYRIGEELKEEGYILRNITPSKVVIFDKRVGNTFEVPLQE